MTGKDNNPKQRRRASKGYEMVVPIAIVMLGVLLAVVMVLIVALALGILPSG